MLWKDEGVNPDRQRSEIQERVGVTQEKREEKFQREKEEHQGQPETQRWRIQGDTTEKGGAPQDTRDGESLGQDKRQMDDRTDGVFETK